MREASTSRHTKFHNDICFLSKTMVWGSGNASDRCGRPVRAGRASFIMRSLFSTHFVPKTLNVIQRHNVSLLQKHNVSLLQRHNVSLLQRLNASLLQRHNASLLQRRNVSLLQRRNVSLLQRHNAFLSFTIEHAWTRSF